MNFAQVLDLNVFDLGTAMLYRALAYDALIPTPEPELDDKKSGTWTHRVDSSKHPPKKSARKGKFVLWALVLFFLFPLPSMQAFWIASGSMLPTLQVQDRVLVAKFWNRFAAPSRGAIYAFNYPEDRSRVFVFRIIAVPGDTVDIKNGVVYINGSPSDEPYVINKDQYSLRPSKFYPTAPFTVPPDQYFTMGDNRPNSNDSRFWGYLPAQDILGPVFLRYWPLTRIGLPR